MRSPASSTHLVWAAIALAAFSGGYYLAGDSEPSRANAAHSSFAGESSSPVAGGTLPSHPHQQHSGGNKDTLALTPEQARMRVFQALAEPNRVERFAQLCELLRGVNAGNWREVMDAFTRQTAFEGRELGDEWKLMLQRVGAVAGEEAVIDALQSTGANRDHRARNTLEGWIMADAATAVAWVKAQPQEAQEILNGAVIYGLARLAPTQALEFALQLSNRATRDWGIGEIVNGAVQEGGFRRGEEVFAAIANRADVGEDIKSRLFQELTRKRVIMDRLRNSPMDSLQWLDPFLTGERSPAGPSAVLQLVAGAAGHDPAKVLRWLDARAERLTPAQTVPSYTAALQAVYQRSPQEFTQWLGAHSTHLAHDPLVEAYTNDLIAAGKSAEATEWIARVKNPQIRQRIEAALAKSGAGAK
jgi:hypothetical protein